MNIVSYAWFRSSTSVYESSGWNFRKVGLQFMQFLPLLVRAHFEVWSRWVLRIHHDDRVRELPYFKALEGLRRNGLLDLIYTGPCESLCGVTGMLSRLNPVFEEGVEYVACRDVDSVPMAKDRRAVEDFILSWKAVHCSHDAEGHAGLMGGLTTVHAERFRQITKVSSVAELVAKYGPAFDYKVHGADQHLLNQIAVRELGPSNLVVHDLHHEVGDLKADVRTKIEAPVPCDVAADVAKEGDVLSPIMGGCYEPLKAFEFYDSIRSPLNSHIREIERQAGVDAHKMMREIAAL